MCLNDGDASGGGGGGGGDIGCDACDGDHDCSQLTAGITAA